MQSGRVDGLKVWNEENHIYYLSVVFDDGNLRPGGQSQYKSEIQVRMTSPNGTWDNKNDFSYTNGAVLLDDGKLVFGTLPDKEGTGSGESVSGAEPSQGTAATNESQPAGGSGSASAGDLSIKMNYDNNNSSANAIAGTIEITNNGKSTVDLSKIKINYYFTKDGGDMVFDCYHAATNSSSGKYTALTDKVKGT